MATLSEYINWLRNAGGHCKSGIGADEKIGMVPVTKLVSPNGSYVIYPGNKQAEKLSPLTIAYLDRRLGLFSPFNPIPEPDPVANDP